MIIFFTEIKNFRIFALIILILANLFFVNNFQMNKITLENSTIHFIRDRHDYKSAFKTVYKNQKQSSTLLLGLNYGFVTQILNKYSVRESINIRDKNLQMKNYLIQNKNKNIYQFVNYDNEIDTILIDKHSFKRNKENFTKWELVEEFSYPKNKDSSIIYLRKIN